MVLNCCNLEKSYGDRLLFSGANLSLEKGDIVGLIGANGTGKTTLFRIITGAEEADDGSVIHSSFLKIGYLEQYVCADSERTAYEEALTVFAPVQEMEQRLSFLAYALQGESDSALIAEQEQLLEQYKEAGGLTYVGLTHAVLSGLGFTEEEQNLPVESLSGGQKSKIGLAKLLLQKPDLVLLDEPTNHLDIRSIDWLEKFIVGSHITTLVISHDRYFLDKICNKVAEITLQKLYLTEGNYSRHMLLKKEREESLQHRYKNVMAEVNRLEGVIEQQRRWNREKNIKTAESKQKQIARMTKDLEAPDEEHFDFSFAFRPATLSGEEVLSLKDVSKTFPDKVLYEHVSFEIKRGDRVAVIGENGIGKTTLLKQILRRGRGIRFGAGVTVGYFDQHQLNLTPGKTAFSEIQDAFPRMNNTEVRSALAVFGFSGDRVFERISELSGGERAKVALCKLMLQKCNFLLLDEPTNHLDIYSMTAPEEALKNYDGTLLVVSHDRYFMNAVADKILCLRPKDTALYAGNYDTYLSLEEARLKKEASDKEAAKEAEDKALGKGGQSYLDQKKLRSAQTRAKTAVKKKEEEIKKLEQTAAELTARLKKEETASDFAVISTLSEDLAKTNEQLEAALTEWETLAEAVASFAET